MRKLFILFISALIAVSCTEEKIVILFDNDVHCAVDGYTKIAFVKDSLKAEGTNVLTVSSGDYLSGGVLGNYSKGIFIVRYMNTVGYDAVTIGNHEFDYTPDRMKQTLELLECQKVCCNIIEQGKQIYPGYVILNAGTKRIAFIGVTTPTTITSSVPSYFKDTLGNPTFNFCNENIIDIIQKNTDLAKSEGADYVIVLSHLGDMFNPIVTSRELISQTEGIDAVLDGHEHHVIACDTVFNKIGRPVILSSTGDSFKNIGMLEINGDKITTELLRIKSIQGRNEAVDKTNEEINSIFVRLTESKKIGRTSSNITNSIRNRENTLGDLITDALRTQLGADMAFINSGFMRADISKGDINYKSIFSSCPFGDFAFKTTIIGQEILDMLEMASSKAPDPSGGFIQVSGMRYSIDTNIVSSVIKDASGVFVNVSGARRVHSVEVMDKNGVYRPINPERLYKVASIDYILVKKGDGISFSHINPDNSELCYTIDIITDYIKSFDNGDLGNRYSSTDNRIKYEPKNYDNKL